MGPKTSKDCSCRDWGVGQPDLRHMPGCQEHRQFAILGVNGVGMARHGPILNDNEAMGSGKVSKYLPGLRDTIITLPVGPTCDGLFK